MIPTKENLAKLNTQKKIKKKSAVHQKISNNFIENSISRNNLSVLKTVYFLSTILQDFDISGCKYDELIEVKIDMHDMLKFTGLTADTITRTTKIMQETSITFIDENKETQIGINLLPLYEVNYGRKKIRLKIFAKIAELIIQVKRNYTPMNIKDLMQIRNKHSLRFLPLLCKISNYSKDVAKRKKMNLEELNLFFGTKYKRWNELERKILKPVKEELDANSKLTFEYEANFEVLGKGRPSFRDVTIDLIIRKAYQPNLL